MKFFFVVFLLLLSFHVHAGQVVSSNKDWSGLLAVASDYRAQESSEGYLEGENYLNLAVGFGYQTMLYVFESATSKTESGNASLSVGKKYTDYMLWGYYRSGTIKVTENFGLEALLGGGLGIYQTEVTTNLMSTATTNKSENRFTGGLSVGLRPVIELVWLSLELRVRAGEDFNPNPTLSALGRVGLSF